MSALETIKKGVSDLVSETKRRLTRAGGDGSGGEYLVEPRVDIYETPEHVSIFVDLPGVKEKGLRIETVQDRLEVKATRADRESARGMSGFVPDGYQVGYRLNSALDPEKIDAQLRDGVLRLVIPRSDAAKPRRIEVR